MTINVLISDISESEIETWIPGSGIATLAMELSNCLAKRLEVYLLIYDNDKNKRGENTIERGKIKLVFVGHPKEVQKIIDKNNIEIIHSVNNRLYLQNFHVPIIQTAWYYPHNLYERIKNELSRSERKYSIISDFGTIQWNTKAYLKDELSFRKAKRIFAVTKTLEEQLTEKFGDKVKHISCPIDTELFKPYERIKDDRISILFVGKASHPQKGFKYLYEALKIVRTKIKQKIVLKLVGAAEPILLNNLSKICSVDYKGIIPRHKLPQVYSESDIFVFPTLYEEFGYVLLEAMSCGTPVISTNIHSMTEIVGDAGILIPLRDSKSLADAIMGLIEDEKLREQFGKEARRRVVEKFSAGVIGKKIIKEYKNIE